MKMPKDWSYFFDEGIRFECTGCGRCCTGEPGGIIALSEDEVAVIAKHKEMEVSTFRRGFVHKIDHGLSLKEKENGDCIFLEENKCSIYAVRPGKCRSYPFWFENLRSPEAWSDACRTCEGIGQGKNYDRESIFAFLHKDLDGSTSRP